jgi:hypothetical protein
MPNVSLQDLGPFAGHSPYCQDMWTAAGFTAGLIAAPRPTRWIATTFTAVAGADVLQIGYAKAESTL